MGEGLALALQPLNLALATFGAFVGTLVGMLPGIGPINAIAILIPLALALDLPPESVLIVLTAIYYGSQYGNSISTILLNVPGTASATVTAIDGYALTQRGEGGSALAMSAVASFFGGTLSIFGLALFAPLLSSWALRFGPAEYFALMVLALSALSSLSGGSVFKGAVATLLGLAFATVGFDPNSAVARYTFGELRLLDGVDFVVLTIGLFAVSEVLLALESPHAPHGPHGSHGPHGQDKPVTVHRAKLTEWFSAKGTMLRGTIIGFLVGVLPGAGGTVASFAAYAAEKRFNNSRNNQPLGLKGVAAPEAANNAASTGAMVPPSDAWRSWKRDHGGAARRAPRDWDSARATFLDPAPRHVLGDRRLDARWQRRSTRAQLATRRRVHPHFVRAALVSSSGNHRAECCRGLLGESKHVRHRPHGGSRHRGLCAS